MQTLHPGHGDSAQEDVVSMQEEDKPYHCIAVEHTLAGRFAPGYLCCCCCCGTIFLILLPQPRAVGVMPAAVAGQELFYFQVLITFRVVEAQAPLSEAKHHKSIIMRDTEAGEDHLLCPAPSSLGARLAQVGLGAPKTPQNGFCTT